MPPKPELTRIRTDSMIAAMRPPHCRRAWKKPASGTDGKWSKEIVIDWSSARKDPSKSASVKRHDRGARYEHKVEKPPPPEFPSARKKAQSSPCVPASSVVNGSGAQPPPPNRPVRAASARVQWPPPRPPSPDAPEPPRTKLERQAGATAASDPPTDGAGAPTTEEDESASTLGRVSSILSNLRKRASRSFTGAGDDDDVIAE